MKNKIFILSLILMSFFIINNTSAWGPNTHLNITQTALSNIGNSTLIAQIINENWDACMAGLEYPDVGIFYYYTDFKEYAGLHNYNVVDEMLRIAKDDRHRAFAYCYKIHLAEDGVAHTYVIPLTIKFTKLPNYLVHPIKELSIEGNFLNPLANRLMERHAEFDDFVAQATGKDWSADAAKLNAILGGGNFYSKAYVPESINWFGKVQNVIYKFVALFISDKSTVDYRELSVKEAEAVLRGETSQLDPSGETALALADSVTSIWTWIITIVIFITILIILWKKRWI